MSAVSHDKVGEIPEAVREAIIGYRDADDYIPAHNALHHLHRAILTALNETWWAGYEYGMEQDAQDHRGEEPVLHS